MSLGMVCLLEAGIRLLVAGCHNGLGNLNHYLVLCVWSNLFCPSYRCFCPFVIVVAINLVNAFSSITVGVGECL